MIKQRRIQYKITNWSEYNKSLINRGRITLWIEENMEAKWYNKDLSGKRGRSFNYSDFAIETCLNLRYLLKLPLRATCGFIKSLFELMEIALEIPDYSRLSRRSKNLKVALNRTGGKGNLDIVVDSTGLKVYGEGEWKVRKHGASKRRTWKKLHLAVDPLDQEIVSFSLTDNSCRDDWELPGLVDKIEEEASYCYGDGAYDRKPCYDVCFERNITLIAPPQRKAKLSNDPPKFLRNRSIERIKQLGGDEAARKQWKQEVDYHTRSLSEVAMFRFKTTCGGRLKSKCDKNQLTEVAIKVNILNKFAKLGMPMSEIVC